MHRQFYLLDKNGIFVFQSGSEDYSGGLFAYNTPSPEYHYNVDPSSFAIRGSLHVCPELFFMTTFAVDQ